MSRAQPALLYAQSGGVTAVINASAAAVIAAAQKKRVRVLAAKNGILGVLREELFDVSKLNASDLKLLANTPGSAFGTCRYKLKSLEEDKVKYQRILDVLKAHHVRWFLYNGGNDSADTALKISSLAAQSGYELYCVGVPKTVDNDLVETDCCPGFGSAAKYTAVSVAEAARDVEAMAETSTKVFVYEAMGRHAGWLAAAAGLAATRAGQAPHVILFPEIKFDQKKFLARVDATVKKIGHCVVVVSEGLKNPDGEFVAQAGGKDAFGHSQLGGVGPSIAALVKDQLSYKVHWTVPDYLQRSARHIASKTDWLQAQAVGKAAVDMAIKGQNGMLAAIKRTANKPYQWKIVPVALSKIANHEKTMPADFISTDGFGITARARRYLAPLIQGQAPVIYDEDGLPRHWQIGTQLLRKQLKNWK